MGESSVTFGAILIFFAVGIVDGLIYNIIGIVKQFTKNNFIVNFVADLVSCLIGGLIFYLCVYKFELGFFDSFEIVCFIFGITFEQIFVKNSFAKAKKLVYNKVKSRKESKKTLKEKESSL